MPDKKAMVGAAGAYLRENPGELVRALRSAAALRVGLPIAALRWLAGQAKGKRAPKNVRLEAVPPGIRASAEVELAGTAVRASATIFVERVSLTPEEARFELRLADVKLVLLDPASDSPVATLLKSGALDLSKPGNLAAFMPKRPALLVEAADDKIVLDLMKHPKLAQNGKLGRLLGVLTPLVTVRGIETDRDHLDVQLSAFPEGVQEALLAIRSAL
jgi:hypothetical protein